MGMIFLAQLQDERGGAKLTVLVFGIRNINIINTGVVLLQDAGDDGNILRRRKFSPGKFSP